MKKLLIISALLLSSCSSLQFKFNTLNTVAYHETLHTVQQPNVTVYTTTHQVFSNMDPWDFGLHTGGNWIHCRYHGFHDLNDWTDFTYSPYFCRPTRGFISGSSWNNNWMWYNQQWRPYMGNVYYGNGYNNYYGWGYQNPWYWNYGHDRHGRRSNVYGRRNNLINISPRRTLTPIRTLTPTRTVRPNMVRPNTVRPNTVRPIRTIKQNEVRQYNTPARPVNNIRPPVNTRRNITVPTKRTQTTNTRRKDN